MSMAPLPPLVFLALYDLVAHTLSISMYNYTITALSKELNLATVQHFYQYLA